MSQIDTARNDTIYTCDVSFRAELTLERPDALALRLNRTREIYALYDELVG